MGNVSYCAWPERSDICLRRFLMGVAGRPVCVHTDTHAVLTSVTCQSQGSVPLVAWGDNIILACPPLHPSFPLPPSYLFIRSPSIPPSLSTVQLGLHLLLLTPADSPSPVSFPLTPTRFAQRSTLRRGDGALIVAYQKLSLRHAAAGYENDSLSVKPMSLPQWPQRNRGRRNGKAAKQMGLTR